LVTVALGRRLTTCQCRCYGRGHGCERRGEGASSGAGLRVAAGATAAPRGICSRSPGRRRDFATSAWAAVGGRPRFGRACAHSGWNMCWMVLRTWRRGRIRSSRTRHWNNLRTRMKMLLKVVGKRRTRRFVFGAAGAACRAMRTFFILAVRATQGYGDTTARYSTTTLD
jgi:hypothetical protein